MDWRPYLGPSRQSRPDPAFSGQGSNAGGIAVEVWVGAAAATDALRKLDRIKDFKLDKWVNDAPLRQAFKELRLNYDQQLASQANYEIQGNDPYCKTPCVDWPGSGRYDQC